MQRRSCRLAASALPVLATVLALSASAQDDAANLLKAPDVRPGLWIELGGADAAFDVALGNAGKNLVDVLVADGAKVADLRAALAEAKVLGAISASAWQNGKLPYANRLINGIVCRDYKAAVQRGATLAECLRVLAPFGTAFFQGATLEELRTAVPAEYKPAPELSAYEGWVMLRMPWPEGMDDWPQSCKDARRSNFSQDRYVGLPDQVRWVADLHYAGSRGRTSSGFSAAGGYNLYVNNQEVAEPLPEGHRTTLACRDSFNGLLRWRRSFPNAWPNVGWSKEGFSTDGKRVFLGISNTVLAIDLATGQNAWNTPTPATDTADPLLVAGGHVLRVGNYNVCALNAATGASEWKIKVLRETCDAAVTKDGKVVVYHGDRSGKRPPVLSLHDLETGKETACFEIAPPTGKATPRASKMMQVFDRYALIKTSDGLAGMSVMLSLADGKWLFDRPEQTSFPYFEDDGKAWRMLVSLDLTTGKTEAAVKQDGNYRGTCSPLTANDQYLIGGRLGYINRATGQVAGFAFNRGACSFGGTYIANGLAYFVRHQCTCTSMLRGELAVATRAAGVSDEDTPDDVRLEKGPAFGQVEAAPDEPGAWPTYRHDAQRSGTTLEALPAKLDTHWSAPVGKQVSAPVAGYGLVLVALPLENQVAALDAATGKPRWTFHTGGPVDSPPTLCAGLAVFGCGDGWVYALRAKDGVLAWRFFAAANARRIVVRERIESAWPVFGSLLYEKGLLYACAGRHPHLDRGLRLWALDPATGAPAWKQAIAGSGSSGSAHTNAFTNDILRSDGTYVYLTGFGDVWDACQMKYYYHLKTGKPYAPADKSGSKPVAAGGPILSAEDGLLVDMRDRAVLSDYHTEARRVWFYHPDQRTYRFPCYANDKGNFTQGPVDGYVGDLIVFRGAQVFGVWRSFASKGQAPQFFGASPTVPLWVQDTKRNPFALRGLTGAGERFFAAFDGYGKPGASGGELVEVNYAEGKVANVTPLAVVPRWDGLASAYGKLFVCTADGQVVALGEAK